MCGPAVDCATLQRSDHAARRAYRGIGNRPASPIYNPDQFPQSPNNVKEKGLYPRPAAALDCPSGLRAELAWERPEMPVSRPQCQILWPQRRGGAPTAVRASTTAGQGRADALPGASIRSEERKLHSMRAEGTTGTEAARMAMHGALGARISSRRVSSTSAGLLGVEGVRGLRQLLPPPPLHFPRPRAPGSMQWRAWPVRCTSAAALITRVHLRT